LELVDIALLFEVAKVVQELFLTCETARVDKVQQVEQLFFF